MSTAVEGFDASIVNAALVAYVGRGDAVRPLRQSEVVRSLVGEGRSSELLALVERINVAADSIDVADDEAIEFSLVPAFNAKIRVRYPWIDDQAGDALCWASRYRRLFE